MQKWDRDDYECEIGEAHGVVIKFGAKWCKPCKELSKTFEKVVKDYPNLTFVEVDGDEIMGEVARQGIQEYPCCLFYIDGSEVDRLEGNVDQGHLKAVLDSWASILERYDG